MAHAPDSNETHEPIRPLAKRPSLAADTPIHLQVGGRRFTTTKETLTEESAFFSSLLSGRWENALEDGSYFIDADPVLFEHILRYLRRGVFPLFFDTAKGHDPYLYLALLEEARYFHFRYPVFRTGWKRKVIWKLWKWQTQQNNTRITPPIGTNTR
jgi:hypothetical protein